MDDVTEEEPAFDAAAPPPKIPGAIVVVERDEPTFRPVLLSAGRTVVGRDVGCDLVLGDKALSRQHFEIVRPASGGAVYVRDLASQNGTVVDGTLVRGTSGEGPRVVRAGRSIVLLVDDAARYLRRTVRVDGSDVVGPALEDAFRAIELGARTGLPMLITGESGVGKEGAARRYHAASPRSAGPYVTVNCGAIARDLAEGLFFGARKGAFTGADKDREGFFGEAQGGVLFLDEIGELPLELQAKLLRTLESGEYHPLGVAKPRRADVSVCAATNRDLNAAVGQGLFRQDLLMRIARRAVHLPPLRERLEEIPILVAFMAKANGCELPIGVRFFESCLLRDWRGENARGLRNYVEQACERAMAASAAQVSIEHAANPSVVPSVVPAVREAGEGEGDSSAELPSAKQVKMGLLVAAYYEHRGDVDAAAKAVGVSRPTAYRLLGKAGVGFRKP